MAVVFQQSNTPGKEHCTNLGKDSFVALGDLPMRRKGDKRSMNEMIKIQSL